MRRQLLPLMLVASCGVMDDKGSPGWETIESKTPVPDYVEPIDPINPIEPITGPKVPVSCEGKTILEMRDGAIWKSGLDGSEQLLHAFGESAGTQSSDVHIYDWKRAGEFHGFAATVSPSDFWFLREIVVLNGDGHPIFQENFDPGVYPELFVSKAGDVAIGLRDQDSYVVRADGTKVLLGAHIPIMQPIGGRVLVSDNIHRDRAQFGWFDLSTGDVTPLRSTPISGYSIYSTDDFIYYHASDGRFVVESPTSRTQVEVPPHEFHLLSDFRNHNESFALFGDTASQYWRVDLNAVPLVMERVLLPEEVPNSNWPNSPGVRGDGAIFSTTTIGESLQAVISHDLGASWANVGEPVLPVHEGFFPMLAQFHAGDSTLVTEVRVGYGYYIESIQALHSGEHVGETHAHGIYTGGPYGFNGRIEMADDGGCAVLWRLSEPEETFMSGTNELVSLDFSTGEFRVLRSSPEATFLYFVE